MTTQLYIYTICFIVGFTVFALNATIVYLEMQTTGAIFVPGIGLVALFIAFAIGLHALEKDQS